MIEVRDDHGLLCAFRLRPGFAAEALDWRHLAHALSHPSNSPSTTPHARPGPDAHAFVHLRGIAAGRAGTWLAGSPSLPEQAREALLDSTPHIAFAPAGNGLAGALGEATSRNLYFLSILSAIFLPLTLITGVFGMNVPALPWLENAEGFWWVMLSMGATLALALLVLRWRRLL